MPALVLAVLLGLAVGSAFAPGVNAEPIGGITPNKPCYIPRSTLPYVTGEKATFSLNGEPAKEHTCQKDGTRTAIVVPDTRGTHRAARARAAVFTP